MSSPNQALHDELLTGSELIQRARAIAPLFAEHAAESERLRRPADAVIRAVEAAGIFRLMVPRAYGGLELDLDTFVDVGLALSEGDASLAWVTTFLIEHNWMFCQFPEAFQRELFTGRSFVLAPGMIAPTGQAEACEGGHRLTGRWQWATGVMHSDWVIAGALSRSGDFGSVSFFALPISDVTVEDTWHVDGMCGTGSNDVVIDDAFVPNERVVSMLDMMNGRAHGATLHAGPLYRTPMIPILLLAASMPSVGQARAAAAGFRTRLQERGRMGGPVSAERQSAQIRLAQAEIEVRQAELLLRDVAAAVMERRDAATNVERGRWAASIAHVVHQCRWTIHDISEASGASAHFLSHPLQRAMRDANVMSCHIAFDRDVQRENFGRLLLDRDPVAPVF